jgi:hypothetical protein
MRNKNKNIHKLLALVLVVLFLLPVNQKAKASGSTLSVTPATSNVGLNQVFNVDITVDTGGNSADGIDVKSLHFNPAVLQVQDDDGATPGVQITGYSIFAHTAITANLADNSQGKIDFSESSTPFNGVSGAPFVGVTTLATIHFKAIAGGSSNLTFDFTLGNTLDSNIAVYSTVNGVGTVTDVLTGVVNGSYTVDTTAPTVSISSPTNGSTVSDTVSINATASDNVGVVGVQFKLDGANLGAEDVVSPYAFSWDTTTTSNASHTLTAVARDAAGNSTASAAVSVTVNNQAFDFSISNGGAKSVTQGSIVTNSISTTLSSGTAASVAFSASGLPSGVTASFSPTSCTPTCSTTLTLTAGAGATVGSSTVTVTAAGSVTHTTAFTLTVNSSSFSRTISINSFEAKSTKVFSATLNVYNSSKVFLKSYAFTTDSLGNSGITFDIPVQTAYLQVKAAPFLTREIAQDLNLSSTYSFPQLLTGDINQDNIINSIDYSILNTNWFTTNASADLNSDGLVNSIDYSYMNKHWLVTGEQ